MSQHDVGALFNFLIVAVVIVATLSSRLRKARGAGGGTITQQRAARQAAATALQQAVAQRAAQQAAAQQAAAQQTAAQQSAPPQQRTARNAQPPAARRVVPGPSMRSTDVPVLGAARSDATPSAARAMLTEAFGDSAHARGAVILAEVLGPPVALR